MKYKHLSKADVQYLQDSYGEGPEELLQIDAVVSKTVFELESPDGIIKRISRVMARQLLGAKRYLGALDRSAFHWTAAQALENGGIVYLDSSRFFRDK